MKAILQSKMSSKVSSSVRLGCTELKSGSWQVTGCVLVTVYRSPHLTTFPCPCATSRGGVRSVRGLGSTMTAWGQSIGISIGMLPQTL